MAQALKIIAQVGYAFFCIVGLGFVVLVLAGGVSHAFNETWLFLKTESWAGALFAVGAVVIYLKHNPDMASYLGITILLGFLGSAGMFWLAYQHTISIYLAFLFFIGWPILVAVLSAKLPNFSRQFFDVDELQ